MNHNFNGSEENKNAKLRIDPIEIINMCSTYEPPIGKA